MARVVAVQPDRAQAATLCSALRGSNEEVRVVDSVGAALKEVEQQLPDLVLLHRFIPPLDEDYFLVCLRTMPGTGHIQTISLPHLRDSSDCPSSDGLPSRPLNLQSRDLRVRDYFFGYFRSLSGTQSIETSSAGCDPR